MTINQAAGMADDPPEMALAAERACFIVVKAREYDAKVAPLSPGLASGSNGSDDGEADILVDFDDDATLEELMAAIDALNEDEQAELVALCWTGRGDFDREQWLEAVESARQRAVGSTARYLTGMPMLGDYLEEGLATMGISITEFEREHL